MCWLQSFGWLWKNIKTTNSFSQSRTVKLSPSSKSIIVIKKVATSTWREHWSPWGEEEHEQSRDSGCAMRSGGAEALPIVNVMMILRIRRRIIMIVRMKIDWNIVGQNIAFWKLKYWWGKYCFLEIEILVGNIACRNWNDLHRVSDSPTRKF